jgi:predicted 3-demethylubiquinone-9 3-methyltransferase (glyoxalase superfamily)
LVEFVGGRERWAVRLAKDRFGLSWQIVPTRLPDLIKHPKAMQAMLKMAKIDLAELERAAKA